MVKFTRRIDTVCLSAPAQKPQNLHPLRDKQFVRIDPPVLQTKKLISLRIRTLRCSGSSLKTRDLKPFRLIFMRTLLPQPKGNSLAFSALRTLLQNTGVGGGICFPTHLPNLRFPLVSALCRPPSASRLSLTARKGRCYPSHHYGVHASIIVGGGDVPRIASRELPLCHTH